MLLVEDVKRGDWAVVSPAKVVGIAVCVTVIVMLGAYLAKAK